ncbi:MAG: ABC transporter permease, partial [Dehalococcoidia bacterium]
MNVTQIRVVAMREVMARLRSRAYQASTAVLLVLAVGGVMAIQILPQFFGDDPVRLGLLPEATSQAEALQASADALDRELELVRFDTPTAAVQAMETGDVDAVLVASDRVEFLERPDTVVEAIVRQSVLAAEIEARADALGLTLEQAQSLLAPVEIQSVALDPAEDADSELVGGGAGQGIGQLSAIVLLMAITFYGQWVLVGVIEEKSNRVVEVLLAAVTPVELLVGKVLGILSLALFQILVTAAALVTTILVTQGTDALPTFAFAGMGLAVLWLVIGLLLYNFLYAAVGATVTRPEDATSVSFPLMVPLMAGYFVGLLMIPNDPDSLLARVISVFPFTAPLTMPSRVASGGGS